MTSFPDFVRYEWRGPNRQQYLDMHDPRHAMKVMSAKFKQLNGTFEDAKVSEQAKVLKYQDELADWADADVVERLERTNEQLRNFQGGSSMKKQLDENEEIIRLARRGLLKHVPRKRPQNEREKQIRELEELRTMMYRQTPHNWNAIALIEVNLNELQNPYMP